MPTQHFIGAGDYIPVKMLTPRVVRENGDGGVWFSARIILPRGASSGDYLDAAADSFSNHCSCAHDCCGHVQYDAYARRTSRRREIHISIHRYINL